MNDMKHRITKAEIVRRFGMPASLWTDVVARRDKEAYHLTAELNFNRNNQTRWHHYIEEIK